MGLSHSPRIVTGGLSVYLDATNPKSYAGSGNTWSDLCNSNNGTLDNAPTYATDGFTFNGTNQSVTINNTYQLGATSFTLDFWVQVLANTDARGIFSWNGDGFNTSAKGLSIRFRTSGGLIEYALNDGVGTATRLSQSGISLSTWYNLSYTHNFNGIITAFRNGTTVATVNYSSEGNPAFTDTYPFLLANNLNGYGNIKLSSFKFYNRALSSAEVLQNFNALRGRFNI